MTVVSLLEVKTHLNYPDPTVTSDDAELQGFIDAAVDSAERYCGPLTSQTVTDSFYDFTGGTWLLLRTWPVLSVQSVTDSSGTVYTAVTADLSGGRVKLTSGTITSGDVTVAYTVGRASVPPLVRLGILDLIAHWWQRGQEGSGPGGGAIGQNAYDQEDTTSPYEGVPLDVLEKWRPYMLPPRAA